jgi:hypothetical protein
LPLYIHWYFSVVAFNVPSSFCRLGSLTIVCHGHGLF